MIDLSNRIDLSDSKLPGSLPEDVTRLAGEAALEWLTACFAYEMAGPLIRRLVDMAKAHRDKAQELDNSIKALEAKARPLREQAAEARQKSNPSLVPGGIPEYVIQAEQLESQAKDIEQAAQNLRAERNRHESAAYVANSTLQALREKFPQPGKPPAILVDLIRAK